MIPISLLKKAFAVAFVACLPCYGVTVWTDSGSGHKWTNPSNWTASVPNSGQDAQVDYIPGRSGPIIEAGESAYCNVLRGPGMSWGLESILTMTGGSLQAAAIKIANDPTGVGRLLQVGGTLSVINRLQPGFNGVGTYEMTGGTMTAGQGLRIGYRSGSTGYAIIHNGQCCPDLIHVGTEGNGTLTIHGGLVDTTGGSGAVLVPENDITGSGHIQLNGGTLKAASISFGSTGSMDITGGQMILPGDYTADMQDFVERGIITAHNGRGDVFYEHNESEDQTEVTASAIDYGVAWNPDPEHRAELDVWESEPLTVSWSPGDWADARDIYFGRSFDEVAAADNTLPVGSSVYQGRQTQTSFTWPGVVEIGDVFYWRIDEVDTATEQIWPGSVWKIQIKDHVMIDDFDQYEDDTQLQNGWQSNASNPTGAQISLSVFDLVYVYVNQSMKLDFASPSIPDYGEVVKSFAMPQDWTSNDIQSLSFHYYGHPDMDQLVIKIFDGANTQQVTLDDKDMLRFEQWQAVDIDLQEFAGIALNQVRSISIGGWVGQQSVPGQTAKIYIDEIVLYGPRCMPDYTVLDRNRDCVIDIEDAAKWMGDWLLTGYQVLASDPGQAGLRVFYTFDHFAGNTAVDMSGNDFHAVLDECGGCSPWDQSDAVSGFSLFLDGSYGLTVPVDVFATVDDGMTLSLWVKADVAADAPVYPVEFFAGQASRDPNQHKWDMVGFRPESDQAYTQWTHYAFVKDASLGVMDIYRDGVLAARSTGALKSMSGASSDVRIGLEALETSGGFEGRLDELRIFDRALTHDEIVHLAQGPGAVVYQPLTPVQVQDEPVADDNINYGDYGKIAAQWLGMEMWPASN